MSKSDYNTRVNNNPVPCNQPFLTKTNRFSSNKKKIHHI